MTWRGRTSASSSASTSWRRGYSRSTRRAVRMSTVRWVLGMQRAMTSVCVSVCVYVKSSLSKVLIGKAAACSVSLLSYSISNWVLGIQLRLVCCPTHYWLYTGMSTWKSALMCNFHCLLTQLSCCLFYRVPVFRHGTAENDYTLTRSFPPPLCTVASLTRSLLRSDLS